MVEKVNKYHRTHRRMIQTLGREPSEEEIARELGVFVTEIQRLQEISQRSISLATPVGDDDSSELGDFLEDAGSVTPTDAVSESLLKAHLREALDELPERERQIIELRFGMKDDRPRTLEEVGREFDITRERVRQIQMKTLNLLREQRRTQNPGEVREKTPKDFVTEVDLLCEELMVNAIGERYPDDAILSEEMGGSVSESGRTWLLDPVDGTANYMKANPMFCACVSVMEGGTVTHAAVAAPRLGDLYHARSGGGAYRESGGRETPLRVSDTQRLEYAVAGADLSLHGGRPQDPGVERVLFGAWQLRALGSAGIRGAWLAAGYLDVSVGTRNTAWDYAPTVLLVSEAGGRATDLSGEPWSLSSDGLIATNAALHDEVLDTLHSA